MESFLSLMFDPQKSVNLPKMAKALAGKLTKEEIDRVMIICDEDVAPFKTMKTVTSLEQLVMAQGAFILSAAPSAPMKKVLAWQASQGVKPVVFGVRSKSKDERSFMSRHQLVDALLAD